ncbi:amidohydrolase 3 [Ilyonectria robusta]
MATVSLLRRVAALVAMGMISYAGAKAPIQRHRTPIADFVFQNGSIYTLDAGSAKVSSLAIKNGVIISLGDDAKVAPLIGSNTQVLDLGGRMAMPGFVDPHMHALQAGQDLLKCNFNYQRLNVEQVLAHLQTCLDSDPERTDDDWLDGVALNYMSLALAGETLTKDDLDSLNTNRPIFVRSNDYHTFVLNSRALVLSNITATTPNPPGGIIEHVPGTQEPSGVLLDGANILIAGPPLPSDEQNAEAARATLQILRENGITTWQDALATNEHVGPWQIIKQAGDLSSRGYFDWRIQPPSTLEEIDAVVAETVELLASRNDNSTISPTPTLKWQSIKAFLDGIVIYSARTAANVDPYWLPVANGTNGTVEWAPDPSALSGTYWDADILSETLGQFFLNGVDAQLHVDGDLAVHVSLNAAEAYRKAHPKARPIRLALAHASLTLEEDWPRFAELGVDAVFSFQWSQLAPMWVPDTLQSLGEYRMDNLDAYARIEKAGRPPVYGSDWPVDPLDVWLALKAGVTRRGDPENPNSASSIGEEYSGLFPGPGLSRESALRAMTINAARLLRADKQLGSLEIGKVADMIVVENNYFEVPDEELGRNRVLVTMLGGEVVYVEDNAQATFAKEITPKFANDNAAAARMARRSLGGVGGKHLNKEERADMARLRKRGQCGHGLHSHKH